MSINLIVVMVSLVYSYVQNHQLVQIKYVQLFVYQSYLYKAIYIVDCILIYIKMHYITFLHYRKKGEINCSSQWSGPHYTPILNTLKSKLHYTQKDGHGLILMLAWWSTVERISLETQTRRGDSKQSSRGRLELHKS